MTDSWGQTHLNSRNKKFFTLRNQNLLKQRGINDETQRKNAVFISTIFNADFLESRS